MSGRPKIYNEQEILDKAIEVFWDKGYAPASADELLKAMNIGKGSFYLAFKGGKKELYEKTLDRILQIAVTEFRAEYAAASDHLTFLKDFFYRLADLPEKRKTRGCYFGNAIVEMANTDDAVKQKAALLLQRLEVRFCEIITEAQQKGQIKNTEPAEALAKYLINLWNGLNITMRFINNREELQKIIHLSLKILD